MAKSRLASSNAIRRVVPPLSALIQASRLINRHCQRSRGLVIAACDGGQSFGSGQRSLGGKSGTGEQHGEQDTKHKAHDYRSFVAIPFAPHVAHYVGRRAYRIPCEVETKKSPGYLGAISRQVIARSLK